MRDAGGVEFWQALWGACRFYSSWTQADKYSRKLLCVSFPLDKIQVIATDEELNVFGEEMNKLSTIAVTLGKSEMILRQLRIDANSPFFG